MITGRPRMLNLKEIEVLQELQIRCELNQEAVTDYAEAMARGEKFPPIVVYQVLDRLLLVEGFHRHAAVIKNGGDRINAIVTAGTMDQARWAAIGANRTNSERLTRADKERAIKMALELNPALSDRAIADRIGVDGKTVARYRVVLPGAEIPQLNRIGKDGKSYAASKPTPRPPALPPIDDPPPAPLDDLPPAIEDDPPPPPVEQLPTDCVGRVITRPEIAAVFKGSSSLTQLVADARGIEATVLQGFAANNLLFRGVNVSSIQTHVQHIIAELKRNVPFALCPWCIGIGCKDAGCKGAGWLTQGQWDAVPKDVQAAHLKGGGRAA